MTSTTNHTWSTNVHIFKYFSLISRLTKSPKLHNTQYKKNDWFDAINDPSQFGSSQLKVDQQNFNMIISI